MGCRKFRHDRKRSTEILQKHYDFKKSTPSFMIYGELGVTPLEIDIKTRILSFWANFIEGTENDKLSSTVYGIIYEMIKTD